MTIYYPNRLEFSVKTKRLAWNRCGGNCEGCRVKLVTGNIVYDHKIPTTQGGDNSLENCQVLCKSSCDRAKTFGIDIPLIAKTKRIMDRNNGIERPKQKIPSRGFGPFSSNTKQLREPEAEV